MTEDAVADQRFFRATTREFLADTMPLTTVRALASAGRGFDRHWWQRGAELGWTAMLVPEDLGGGSVSGHPMTELAIVAEELGRAAAPGPFVVTNAVLAGLTTAGPGAADTVTGIVAGTTVATWAVYEPGGGFDVLGGGVPTRTRAVATADGYRIDGHKDRVEAADQSDLLLVTADSADGPIQLLVPADADGVSVRPAWTLDLTRRTAQVDLDGVQVGPDAAIHTGAAAVAAIRAHAGTAALLTAAESTGATAQALDGTAGWLFDRYTFGRPLASYQALKHRMADNKTWLEACRATSFAAAASWDADGAGADEAVSVAKSYVGSKAPVIAQDCVQLHGGIGVTWEHDLHLYLRRITLGRALYGTPEEHRRHITDLLEQSAA